jgi:TolB-like protein
VVKLLLSEMRRRRVFGTAALYIVGAWLVLQVADVVFPALDIPEEAIRYVLYAVLLGFPVALVFGWYFDIGSGGIHRTLPVDPAEAGTVRPLGRGDYLVLAALVLVAGTIIYSTAGHISPTVSQYSETAPPRDGPPMIAVLPFTATSREGDSEFFAAGVHDDLLTQLAQLQSMRVISRTSVLEYKGTTRNIREIGAALGADAVLEGGVQSAGERIRINAQLIDARTDEHLWAETYDRQLLPANIFEVQSEIARAIAAAMNTTLTRHDDQQLSVVPTNNMAAYRAWRKAMEIRDTQGTWLRDEYRRALEEAIDHDPGFVLAMAELVGYLGHANFYYEVDPEYARRADDLLEQIHGIAPDSAVDYFARAYYAYYTLKDYEGALEFVDRALELSPSDIRLLAVKTWIQRRQGDAVGRIETLREIKKLDPRDWPYRAGLVNQLLLLRRYEEALAELDQFEVENSFTEATRIFMELREHRDLQRYANEVKASYDKYEPDNLQDLWEAYMVTRNFAAADALLPQMEIDTRGSIPHLQSRLVNGLLSAKFQGQEQRLEELLAEARLTTSGAVDEQGQPLHWSVNLDLGLVAALDGRPDEAERCVRRFLRGVDSDLAGKVGHWHYACRVLGLAELTTATVECLRGVMSGASNAHWFLEPFMPEYDPMRGSAEFAAMMAEFESGSDGRGSVRPGLDP